MLCEAFCSPTPDTGCSRVVPFLEQLRVGIRFHSLAFDDPDNSDTETEQTSRPSAEKPHGDASAASDETVYFDVTDDALYFQAGTDPLPREQWDIAPPVNFSDLPGIHSLIHQIDEAFQSTSEIATPFGVDDTGQTWRWSDVGACHMPREPPMYPTLTIGTGSMQRPVASSVDHANLFT